jgi:hypothetical protein
MQRVTITIVLTAALGLHVTNLHAQAQVNRTAITGTGAGSNAANAARTQGFQQTGQISSDAAIQRNQSSFVGGSGSNFMSRTGTGATGLTGSTGLTGFSGLGGLGGGLSGFGGLGGLNNFGGGFGRFNSGMGGFGNQFGQGNSTTSNTRQVRTSLRAAFPIPAGAHTAVMARFQQRLPKIPGLETVDSVAVSMDGKTAVLQGVVTDENQRDLIERLALLEPGISDVRNELSVGSPSSSPELPRPPRTVPTP